MNMYAVNECRCIKKNHTLSIIKKTHQKDTDHYQQQKQS